ncbi:hypothetical protein ACNUI4_32400 [Pseudomonas aeruginosa]
MSTGRPIEELKQVVVTELMVKAAMDYVLGLWDRDVDIFLLEDVFRIMAVLQPRPLDIPKIDERTFSMSLSNLDSDADLISSWNTAFQQPSNNAEQVVNLH